MRKVPTYDAQMCSRRTHHTVSTPSVQMTIIGHTTLPHWMLRTDMLDGASQDDRRSGEDPPIRRAGLHDDTF